LFRQVLDQHTDQIDLGFIKATFQWNPPSFI